MPNFDYVPKIYVVGSCFAQNELLVHHIENSLVYPCINCQEINQILSDYIKKQKALILLDYKDDHWRVILNDIKKKIDLIACDNDCFIALFNVVPTDRIEKEIPRQNIRGIFYTHYSKDILLKGIKAILSDDLWLPRAWLNPIFLKQQNYETYDSEILKTLSLREKQVIDLLSSGYTNDMIADELCISIHTVKSHIYKIYKKINVTNRLQAVRWTKDKLIALA